MVALMTVTYFEKNQGGITVYGIALDMSTLHTIFGIIICSMDTWKDHCDCYAYALDIG